PEHEVQRVALGRGHRHALAGAQVVERLARELAVAFEAAHGIVDVAVVGTIGQAFFFQAADDVEHLPDILGGARFAVGRLHTQGALVSMHGGDIVFGNLADAAPGFHGPPDDLVVDVGDVAHIVDGQSARAQPALHHVEGHQHARMPQVTVVVHGHAANVHAHLAGPGRLEWFFSTRQRIVDMQHDA